jgi:hypothetical protein
LAGRDKANPKLVSQFRSPKLCFRRVLLAYSVEDPIGGGVLAVPTTAIGRSPKPNGDHSIASDLPTSASCAGTAVAAAGSRDGAPALAAAVAHRLQRDKPLPQQWRLTKSLLRSDTVDLAACQQGRSRNDAARNVHEVRSIMDGSAEPSCVNSKDAMQAVPADQNVFV